MEMCANQTLKSVVMNDRDSNNAGQANS